MVKSGLSGEGQEAVVAAARMMGEAVFGLYGEVEAEVVSVGAEVMVEAGGAESRRDRG